MEFLFRKALALIGRIDDPAAQKRLFDRFDGDDTLLSLYERMEKAASDPGIGAPDVFDTEFPDPNMVAGYLDHPSEQSRYQRLYEESCLDSDILLAEAASVSIILNLYQEKPTRAPKSCRRRAYLVDEKTARLTPESPAFSAVGAARTVSHAAAASAGRQDSPSGENPFAQNRNLPQRPHEEDDFARSIDTFGSTANVPSPLHAHMANPDRPSPPPEPPKRKSRTGNLLLFLMLIGILYAFGPRMIRLLRNSGLEPSPLSESQSHPSPTEPEFILPPLPDKTAETSRHEIGQIPSSETPAVDKPAPWKSLSLLPETESSTNLR